MGKKFPIPRFVLLAEVREALVARLQHRWIELTGGEWEASFPTHALASQDRPTCCPDVPNTL